MIKVFRHHVPRFSLLLAAGEVLLFSTLIAFAVSSSLAGHWVGFPMTPLAPVETVLLTGAIVLLATLAMGATGLYNREVMFEMDAVLGRMALSFSIAFIGFAAIAFLLSGWAFARDVDYRAAAIALPLCAVLSLAIRAALGGLAKRETLKRRILVVGRGLNAAKIAQMARMDRYRFTVAGYVDLAGQTWRAP